IKGGDYTPIQFRGNRPDFVEAEDVGKITDWVWFFSDESNESLQLNGTTDSYVIVNNVSSDFPSDAVTIEFWMKSSDSQNPGTPISYASASDANELGIYNYTNFDVRVAGVGSGKINISANDGKWHHIAMTWESSTGEMKFYKDGALVYTQTIAQGDTIEGGGTLVIGQDQDTLGGGFQIEQAFRGNIDEVMIWRVVRTAEQIREDMGRELIGTEDGLVLYMRFESGDVEGDTIKDRTGKNDGIMNNCSISPDGHPIAVTGIWDPVYEFPKAGTYDVGLKVLAESGKWSTMAITKVTVVDGKIAGYVKAADLRTPVKGVWLTLKSAHVDKNALARVAETADNVYTTDEGWLRTETDNKGYYEFPHLPLGTYQVIAYKKDENMVHEFKKAVQTVELTLNGPNQLAVDFVDLSVYPVGGRIVYSIKKNGQDVLVKDVKVIAQPIGSTSLIESVPSTKSLTATGTNYSLPLFAGKYYMLAKREGHDIRIKEDTPGYDPDTGVITIEGTRTDVDFIDYTTRKLKVIVQDPGENPISKYPSHFSNAGDPIKVTVSGDNGQDEGFVNDDGEIEFTLNPGKYTVTIQGARPESKEVDLRGGDNEIIMTIPVKIELVIEGRPKLFDAPDEFLELFGLSKDDNPEGYMYYYPPEPRSFTYTIKATANGHPVEDFTLYVTDEISMMTEDPPEEQEIQVEGSEYEYTIVAGLPKMTDDDPPLAAPKKIKFKATKEGYEDSDIAEDEVIVLGDVPVGSAARIVSIPVVNYLVLHDPPGDGSYAYLDDSVSTKGLVVGLQIKIREEVIPVYPSPWSKEREVKDFSFGKEEGEESEYDMQDRGLLGYRDSVPTLGHFTWAAVVETATGAGIVALGPLGYALQLAKLGAKAASITPVGTSSGIVAYEVSPGRRLETPSEDEFPDILGPGKGDIYFGEGWTLGLQTKYRLGIRWNDETQEWELETKQIETYDILERTNQYVYTVRDIENLIEELEAKIEQAEDESERQKLENAREIWQTLLDANVARKWRDNLTSDNPLSLEEFAEQNGLSSAIDGKDYEMLIISAGPSFEYSRTVSVEHTVSFSLGISVESSSEFSHELVIKEKFSVPLVGFGVEIDLKSGSSASIGSSTEFGAEWESGCSAEQTVGFVLKDDDIGDNIITYVFEDPRWGTPLFLQDPGSITSDPWEPGTNKGIDATMELLEEPSGPMDYHDGAHYKIKVKYTGLRSLDAFRFDFIMFTLPTLNPNQAYVEFNGYWGPYSIGLDSEADTAVVDVLIKPPKRDLNNSEEKQYEVTIILEESGDQQVHREITLKPKFADLRAPRAVIKAPYDGERISPVLFPEEDPFEIRVVSEDTDIAKIQLQIRSKQPDGVWEPWRNLSGMVWEEGKDNPNVTVFDRLDRRPPHREFVFKWSEDEIRSLGVGEYALRAVATDKATPNPNTDIDPPFVVFMVDDAKPSVLCTVPDYQARESERIYRGELSVTFTDDMRASDFSDRTFYVTDLLDGGKKVAGYVSYSPALRKAVFVPVKPFRPNGYYRVEIKTDVDTDGDGEVDERGVHDLAGNPLDTTFVWTFRTTDVPFEPTWSINWRVSDGVTVDSNNVCGVEYGAEDGEDEKDVRAVPTLGSQMRMCFLDRERNEFDRDIRPADGRLAHHWFFVIDNAKPGSTVTIEYQPSTRLTKATRQYQILRLVEFDQNGEVSNVIDLDPTQAEVDPNTGQPGYVVAYQYVNQGERSRYFRLDVQKAEFIATKWEVGTSGWKFFSVPITPRQAEPFVNLGDDIEPFQMFQYDTASGGYKVYPYDIGEVGLETGKGYFTRLNGDVEVDVGGAMNQGDVVITLEAAGWHAIGNPFIKEVRVADLKVNGQPFEEAVAAGAVEGTLYRWRVVSKKEAFAGGQTGAPSADGYQAVGVEDSLKPWEGYWLKTNQPNVKLTIPAPPDLPNRAPVPDYLKPPMAPKAAEAGKPLDSGYDLKLTFKLTSAFASDITTTLGTHPEAEEGRDRYDRSEPPTLSKTVAAYFNGGYDRDIRPSLRPGQSEVWKLTVFTDRPDSKMVLRWDEAIENIPGDVMLYIRRTDIPDAQWLDMREVRSIELPSKGRITEINLEIKAERFEMTLPSKIEVEAGEGEVIVRWRMDDNPFVEGYVLERRGEDGTVRFELPADAREFVDKEVQEERCYSYRLTVLFRSGAELSSDEFTVTVLPVIKRTALLQSYPNPFNPEVWIPYELAEECRVEILIFDMNGRLVRRLDLGVQPRGRYISKQKAAHWDGRNERGERVGSGVYFYTLKAGRFTATRKMIIRK
ncbi:hypothetical protein DRP77_01660, partial [Candidatus Poribacteria bacterium]